MSMVAIANRPVLTMAGCRPTMKVLIWSTSLVTRDQGAFAFTVLVSTDRSWWECCAAQRASPIGGSEARVHR